MQSMKDTLIAQIQSFTLEARAALESEAGRQLEGIYGWLPDGRFADTTHYPAVNEISEAAENRRRLESYAEEEKTTGLSPKDARIKLVRETAFTWLNRLVALRMMEERRIIRPTVGKLDKSNSFIFWLTADGNGEMYVCHQKGALPQNAMGEGPSDMAYRKFLLSQCTQLARDVSVLFDPENLSSRLFPRPPVLKRIMESMNGEDLAEAWQTGNEETVGWVYQAFNAEELQAAFTAARLSKKKFEARDIPSVTQLFTIRWVVQFLVENTLGRLWVEMHPDSKLRDGLNYLVPFDSTARALKSVQDITFLDPSCGSMHFGLVAFDLFVEMYREELENAGQEGWPDKASVASVDDIPASIIVNNIYGVDIDLRAVQLSALTLFLRARTLNKECVFSDRNLACANVEAITGGRLETFISQSKFSHPIYERILRAMAASLKDSDQLGSLLRLERTLEYLIAEERKKVDAKKQLEFSFPGVSQEQFATREGVQEFFDILYEQLLRHLDNFVKESRDRKLDPGHFASETAKGLRFLGIASSQYDVVATNPPYLSSRKMNKGLADLLKDQYSEGKSDLYAAFILRCQELARQHGFVGMLTMHSFMFISSYENLRDTLREHVCVETLAHFGGGLFAVGNPGTLQTAAHVLRKEPDQRKRQEHRGTYFRLVREKDSDAKRIAFEAGLVALKAGRTHPLVFICQQEDFDMIPDKPWVYWMPDKIRKLFVDFKTLKQIAPAIHGTATYDNKRFLRFWWEPGFSLVIRNANSFQDFNGIDYPCIPYMKGGTPIPWFGNQSNILRAKKCGKELSEFLSTKRDTIRAEGYNFHKGVTWSDVSSKGFAGRLSPGGFVHDVKGMTCYPPDENILTVLGLFNSTFAKFVLGALNPTISFQVGDIERLPIPGQSSKALDSMVKKSIALARQDSADSETTYDFVHPPISVAHVDERRAKLRGIEDEIDKEVTRLYNLTEEDRLALKAELEGTALVPDEEADGEGASENGDNEDTTESAWTESALARAWISYAFGVVLGHYAIGEPDGLGHGDFDEQTAAAIRALIDADGVMVSEKGYPQDITVRTLRCLELMRGREIAHTLIRQATDSEADPEDLLRNFLDRFTGSPEASFWRHHIQLYRKRPIFWPLQSPKRKFTVWVFQERFTTDTLFKVRSEFADPKARWLEGRIKDLKAKADASAGAEKRGAEKEASQLAEILDDVQEFSKRLNAIIQKGYTPHIDDGVLINAAPLWELLPSWPDTKKAWQELEEEKYDWAHQAMDHWPGRVKEKCKTNKSFAIAHGLG
jgi:Eco57I restriction-modification methylase